MGLTKFVLKRPVTTVLAILCLIVFGLSSVFKSPLELMPDMNMSMIIVMTVYPGASPDDVSELVTKPIEDSASTLSGLDTISSSSSENMSLIMLMYDYGTDMNDAYDDLKKQIDLVKSQLPEDVEEPVIAELNTNLKANMTLSVSHGEDEDLYNYVNNTLVPEFEKLSTVAEVALTGGVQNRIKVELMPEKLKQYGITMSSIANDIAGADITYPAGDTLVGDQKLSVSTEQPFKTLESLKDIPLTAASGQTVYLSDVAAVYMGADDAESIARYSAKGSPAEDIVALSISKQQDAATLTLSEDVHKVIDRLVSQDPTLNITIVDDDKDSIMSSLSSVIETMIMAVVISMVIIWLFFGDLKASLIVGSSIPVSILSSLILMQLMGFSLNVITLSALVLGVGMMVDNSTVVLESCFRATDDTGFKEFANAALRGTGIVYQSVVGSTVTTCVVFLPLAMLGGMTGMMFKPLGFTIVFCMTASLISAIAVVPLCYMIYKPIEKKTAPLSRPVERMQDVYRAVMGKLIHKRALVMIISVLLLVLSVVIAMNLRMELMAEDDQGQVNITAEMKPGMKIEKTDAILKQIEEIISVHPDVESYIALAGSTGMSMSSDPNISVYLKDDRKMETDEVVAQWKQELAGIPDTNITVEAYSQVGAMMGSQNEFQVNLESTDYDDLKAVSDTVSAALSARPELTKVHSSLENAASVVKVTVNPIKAKAAGLTPAQVGGTLNNMLSGITPASLEIDGEDVDIKVEYPEDRYQTLDQLQSITLQTPSGSSVALTDVAEIHFADSPASISRQNKQYRATISGIYTEHADSRSMGVLMQEAVNPNLTENVSFVRSSMDESMAEEFAALFQAIALAVFLVFVVMAAQFESPKFSVMVMTTIPFCLIGAFGLLWLADSAISMTSLLGFLMLVGTVVNNGILYVDTVNQYRMEMDLNTALIEAGATRLRPILMTTLTTVVSMIPMALAFGDSGTTTQGLALVNIGGLTASTILALLMLPVYYSLMSGSRKREIIAD
ncbi:MAG: efflux RND transporter permease subunit [Clostridiales bacterium]|nr:efflux RND transporter permease subunit [Clostridiales bacterium]